MKRKQPPLRLVRGALAPGWRALTGPVAAPPAGMAGARSLVAFLRATALVAGFAALIALAIGAFSVRLYEVDGLSMSPGLADGDGLIVNRRAYSGGILEEIPVLADIARNVPHFLGRPERGDVIVFDHPGSSRNPSVKRVIGLPGDTVQIDPRTGDVLVNGERLPEANAYGPTPCLSSCGPWLVPAGNYFVLGDNRAISSDSRLNWFVPEDRIIGEVVTSW